jgi:hypothetical protein
VKSVDVILALNGKPVQAPRDLSRGSPTSARMPTPPSSSGATS